MAVVFVQTKRGNYQMGQALPTQRH